MSDTLRPVASPLVDQAWELAYLDPARAGAIGRGIAELGDRDAGWGWLHVALAEVRGGDLALARRALDRARAVFQDDGDRRGLMLVDEVQAIERRRSGDVHGAARLQRELDGRAGNEYNHHDRFLAHNARAITHKLLGQVDEALRHLHAAAEAAQRCPWPGPKLTALCNLGSFHHELFNLDEAQSLSEEALQLARASGAREVVAATAANLVVIHHAAGRPAQAQEMALFLQAHPQELPPNVLDRHALPLALGHLAGGELEATQRFLDRAAAAAALDADSLGFWAWVQSRCALRRGDAVRARAVAEHALHERDRQPQASANHDQMQLLLAASEACETLGDCTAALAHLRQAHGLYTQLVERGARVRSNRLQVSRALAEAQRERDLALDSHRSAEDDRRRLTELNQALRAQVAETEMLHARLREQALRDPLTGLHNRRYLFEAGPAMLELARRQDHKLCVVLLDLDHFKLLNDTYGHQAGDTVLTRFAALLGQMFRRSDLVCRHGGEEFVAVMPDIDTEGAQSMLDRLLAAFQAQPPTHGQRRLPRCTFSAGIALFPLHGHTLEQLLSRADKALYAAKHLGRARIELAPQSDFNTFT